MTMVFSSKVLQIGSSLGILIPKEIVQEEKLKVGKEIQVSIIHRNFKLLDQLMGTVKSAKPFVRDRIDGI